ncbi:MMPL family transporter [Actinomadura sp. DC4]|uniref:MMPL family transporter n=1 Tax=Actinomadura sp. DC4 TaxID=3055069 RepID=UPI0025B21F89|nr:MMPL family transporter [Actinomadura sp. DC4]MDN3354416.1 MMPL family transporter [Actinomadura sp. DC4]
MEGFARWSVRHRWWVIGGWLVLVLALAGLSHQAGGAEYKNTFRFSGRDSQDARAVLERDFPQAAGDGDQIVFHTTAGRVTDPAVRDRMRAMFARVERLPHVVQVADPYASRGQAMSRDGTTAFATVTFDAQAGELPEDAIGTVVDTARAARTSALQVELGGQAVERTVSQGPGPATAVGLTAAVLVLLVMFGSVTAMLMPILTALIAVAAGVSVNALVTHVMDVNTGAEVIALMIALGVGVDYSLFIVSRFRGMLAEGRDPEQAAVGAVNTSGRAVLFAGGIVVVALLGLLLFGVGVLDGIAVSAVVEAAFTMAAALTLLPAVLSLLGRRVNGLRVPGRHPAGSTAVSPRLGAWADLVRRHRWAVAVGTVAVLAVLALPALSLRLGSSDAGADPASATTRRAYDLLADGFGPGFNGPLLLTVRLPSASYGAVLGRLSEAVAADPGVASVGPPRISPSGTAAVLRAYPATSPQSAATGALVRRLRVAVIPRAVGGGGVAVHVGGPTATFVDLGSLLGGRLVPFVAVVVAIGFVLLLVVFRSLAIPLTAAAMNLLSIGAALGVVVAVFQKGWTGLSTGPVHFAVPVMTFAIVFGLSTDYQVFLLTRVQEEWHTHGDNPRAVREGMGRVSGVITGAAVIMIAVFGSFVLGGARFIAEVGVGLAVAVTLDAFLIRFMLVPAIMYILGDRNWRLPRRLRRLPRVHIEPAGPPPPAYEPRR